MAVSENSHRAPESSAKATAVQALCVCNAAGNLAKRLDCGAFTAALSEHATSHPSPSTIH
jgi:hypothetical protein